ncbi:hypothetical protein F2Q69_00058211 [Brassica cretica]|uniref:Uncharacterized protein n=1 Tax=Brassica cretica TaxID=69181 RepID=A0A8S9RFW2_BRACR|nr:hypothetical protein F2Q69_00058211 [Brassica cretica]
MSVHSRVDDDGWELDQSSDKAVGDSRRRRSRIETPKAGDGGAEEAPTSRRLGRRRRSWISLHLPDSKPKLTSLLHHAKNLHTTASLLQPLSHHRCRFTPELTTMVGSWTRAQTRRSGIAGEGEAE